MERNGLSNFGITCMLPLSFVPGFTPVFGDFRGNVGYPLEMYFPLCTCVFYYHGQENADTPVSNM